MFFVRIMEKKRHGNRKKYFEVQIIVFWVVNLDVQDTEQECYLLDCGGQ
jgi:hypothetical protein